MWLTDVEKKSNASVVQANQFTANAAYWVQVIERRTFPSGMVLLSDFGGGRGKFATFALEHRSVK